MKTLFTKILVITLWLISWIWVSFALYPSLSTSTYSAWSKLTADWLNNIVTVLNDTIWKLKSGTSWQVFVWNPVNGWDWVSTLPITSIAPWTNGQILTTTWGVPTWWSIGIASTSTSWILSSTDWNTFNGKATDTNVVHLTGNETIWWNKNFTSDIYWNWKVAIRTNDTWLRLNQLGSFTNWVYTPWLLAVDWWVTIGNNAAVPWVGNLNVNWLTTTNNLSINAAWVQQFTNWSLDVNDWKIWANTFWAWLNLVWISPNATSWNRKIQVWWWINQNENPNWNQFIGQTTITWASWFKYVDWTQGAWKVLTSDINGVASWQATWGAVIVSGLGNCVEYTATTNVVVNWYAQNSYTNDNINMSWYFWLVTANIPVASVPTSQWLTSSWMSFVVPRGYKYKVCSSSSWGWAWPVVSAYSL